VGRWLWLKFTIFHAIAQNLFLKDTNVSNMGFSFLPQEPITVADSRPPTKEAPQLPPPVFHSPSSSVEIEFETLQVGESRQILRKRIYDDALLSIARSDNLIKPETAISASNTSASDLLPKCYEGFFGSHSQAA
jgi:hypothetical protein